MVFTFSGYILRFGSSTAGDGERGNASHAKLLAAAAAPLWALDPVSLEWQAAWEALQSVPPPPAAVAEPKTLNPKDVKPKALNRRCSEQSRDDSVRCRFSHICEGSAACPAGAKGAGKP